MPLTREILKISSKNKNIYIYIKIIVIVIRHHNPSTSQWQQVGKCAGKQATSISNSAFSTGALAAGYRKAYGKRGLGLLGIIPMLL